MRKNLLIVSAIVIGMLCTGCQGKKKTGSTDESTVQKALVKAMPALKEKVARTEVFTTELRAHQHNFIVPPIADRIDRIYVEVGDRVKRGQLLVSLNKNQYNQARAQLANAETTLARLEYASETGGISRQQIDEVRTSVTVLREQVEVLEKNLELRSPIDGIVTGRYNEEGDLFTMSPNADGGVGILRVMNFDNLKAYAWVPEQYFTQVYNNMPVSVSTETFPGQTFEGKVSRIAPTINTATRSFEVEVSIPNRNHNLRPGMFARATFNMGEVMSVTVKDLAVQRQTGTNDRYVFVVKNGIAEKRPVNIGNQTGDRIEILSGVEEGEMVVTAGTSRLIDGSEVEISAE